MWGIMSALGLGVLAHDKYKKSKIPPYGTYEYYHYAHPEMTDFQICKLRNEMSGEITDAEVKVLFDAGIPLGMWHKDKQPIWDKLAKEKEKVNCNNELKGMTEEEYVDMLKTSNNYVYGMGDYEVYYSDFELPYIYLIYDPINKKIIKNGWRMGFTKAGAVDYFKTTPNVYIKGSEKYRMEIKEKEDQKKQKATLAEKSNEIIRIRNLDNLVYKNGDYELYLDRDASDNYNIMVYDGTEHDFIRNVSGEPVLFTKINARKYVDERVSE